MRMFIATPSARDAERFGAVHDAAWRQHYADLFAPDYLAANTAAQRAQALLDRLNDPDWAARWALDQGAPAGILLLHRQGRSAQIDSLYLLAEHRGRGLGRRLVEAARDQARAWGCACLTLWVLRDNPSAQGFYRHCGFSPTGQTRTIQRGLPVCQIAYHMPL